MTRSGVPSAGPRRHATYAPATPWVKAAENDPGWVPTDLGNGRTLWRPPAKR